MANDYKCCEEKSGVRTTTFFIRKIELLVNEEKWLILNFSLMY